MPFDVTKITMARGWNGWYLIDRGGEECGGPFDTEADARRELSEWEREDYEAKQQELE